MLQRFIFGFFVLWTASAAAPAAATEWSHRMRDVFVDGQLDRDARVYAARDGSLVAVVAGALPGVLVFDADALTVGWLDTDALHHEEDPTRAGSSGDPAPDATATCRRVDDLSYLVAARGHTVLVAAHQGLTGAIELADLWRVAPPWKSLADRYTPDPASVADLGEIDRDIEVHVVLGTWCGDSQRHVPQLVKALEAAANPRLRLRLTSIRRGFEEPLELARAERLTNVPTVIVTENGREIGRIVETPATETMEADLAALLAGREPEHRGRWQRERLLARGTYRYTGAAGAARGTEDWELFSDEDGGRLLHCRAELDGRVTEVWQRRDRGGVTSFVEITRHGNGEHGDDETVRSRHWIEDGRLRSILRGNTTGIVEQTAALPVGWTALLPAAAAQGWPVEGDDERIALRFHRAPAAAQLEPLTFAKVGRREIATPAGRFQADGVEKRLGTGTSRWWLHPELAIPVAGETENGDRVVLAELEVFED